MDKLVINGGVPLTGEVLISGSKNAVLPIMAATIIAPAKYTLFNVPRLQDTFTMVKLLKIIGADVNFNQNTMYIDTTPCHNPIAPYDLVKTMRASFYVLGPLLSRFNHAEVSLPGGCAWGPRPVNYHLEAMESLGAEIKLADGMMILSGSLVGSEINFIQKSVGATGNALMAAVSARGETIIRNASKEPEIEALCLFLNKIGANISGIGTSQLIINGTKDFKTNIEYKIIPDRIEAGTFLISSAITSGSIQIKNVNPKHLNTVIEYLIKSGSIVECDDNMISIDSTQNIINPIDMRTDTYPGFPTDLQAQWMALMTLSNGNSNITETIYFDRFTHISELSRLGANIKLSNNVATVTGIEKLYGAPVMSTDIRASASLILAALAAQSTSVISRIYHIDRGYENIESKFKLLNASIERIKE